MTTSLLLPDYCLPGCAQPVITAGDACPECVRIWGPYICRQGEKPAWYPSGWVQREDGAWGIPWGVAELPDVIRARGRAKRHAAAARLELQRDLSRIGAGS